MSYFNITSESVTGWQFGSVRKSLDRRTKSGNDNKEEYLNVVSITRFRDHKNVTAVAEIDNDVGTASTFGVDGSMAGAQDLAISVGEAFNPGDESTFAYIVLQDTHLEPIERQGSMFVRETQEWTAESGKWTEGGWK